MIPKLVGINNASTFTGFCSYHDGMIFSPLEQQEFVGTPEQNFLWTYRALCREFYAKKAQSAFVDQLKLLGKGKNFVDQIRIQEIVANFQQGADSAIKDSQYHKVKYDDVFLAKNFSQVRSYLIKLSHPPEIMCSASFFPTENFDGVQLQNLLDLTIVARLIGFSSFAAGDNGAIVFSWLSDSDDVCIPFIKSLDLRPDSELPDILVRFFFETTENLHMKPDWWEGLDQKTRSALIRRMSNSANPTMLLEENRYRDDGVRCVDWQIESRTCYGFDLQRPSQVADGIS